ncbi:baculoviral IAP repeat-containing protein 7 isoform X1 [Biomphalaria glabrata]|nr:baculoviral IAP repeat-containing protein 7 isoform X1 [Biomphalaria glabrata]
MSKCGKTSSDINECGTEGFVDPKFTILRYKASNQRNVDSIVSKVHPSTTTYKDQYNDSINVWQNSSGGSNGLITAPKTSLRERKVIPSAIIEASDLSNNLMKLNLRTTTADGNVSQHSSTKGLWRTFDVKNKNFSFCKPEKFKDNQFKMCREHSDVDILSDLFSWRHFRWKQPKITVCIMNSAKMFPPKRALVSRSQAYDNERNRLLTFAKYPRNAEKSAISLAANGFIFEGSSKRDAKVKCAFCGKELPVWKLKSTWKNIHKKMCPMKDNNNSLNMPINLNTSHLTLQTLNRNIQRSTNNRSLPSKHLIYMRSTNVLQWANKSFVTASSITESGLARHRITGRCVQETGQREASSNLGSVVATNLNSCPEITSLEESHIRENEEIINEASSNNQYTLTGSNLQQDDIRTIEAIDFETTFELPEFFNAPVAPVPEVRTANATDNNNAPVSLRQDLHTSLEHPEINLLTFNITSAIPEINSSTANTNSAIPEINAPTANTTSATSEINAPTANTTSAIPEINAPTANTTSAIPEINAPTVNTTSAIPEINAPTANTTSAIPEINALTANTTSVSAGMNTAPPPNERQSPGTIPQARSGSGREPTYEELGIITERPKRPEYALAIKRLETFVSWPRDHHLSPEELVDAGFYYAGYGDCTRCFYCGGGLRNWEEDDNVWVEHARWFSKCAFLRQKMGQVFVNTVQGMNTEYDKITIAMVFDRLGVPSSTFQLDTLNTPLKRDAAVRSVTSLGYQENDVLAIAHMIKQEGNILSSDSIVQRLVQEEKRPLESQAVTLLSSVDTTQALESIQIFKERNNQLRNQTCCKICMDKEVAVVFLPCGHLISCAECASAMRNCPLCRQDVRGIVRAFMC